jgi:peptide/nickel transport system ATP-binding protein
MGDSAIAADAALVVEDLQVGLSSGDEIVTEVALSIGAGEVLGLVGESGSGKTTTALALLAHAGEGVQIESGEVEITGERVSLRKAGSAKRLRGRLVSYVPQDPGTSLNPSRRIANSIRDVITVHAPQRLSSDCVAEALAGVDLPTLAGFARRFPHQLSGGQQQRVTIAMALAAASPVILLDEPTTGLDVVTQARVLAEIDRLKRERGLAMIYVSHDLSVVAQVADRIAVMYAGRVVEEGPAQAILAAPAHPYTRGLLASIPDHRQPRVLQSMPGVSVGVGERPEGCAFCPRCPQRVARCETEQPAPFEIGPQRTARCFEWQRTPSRDADRPSLPRVEVARETLLSVQALRAVHGRGSRALVAADDVSFDVRYGESVGLVGESGSGKTTVARCVAGLHAPAAGRIVLDGQELAGRAKDRSRQTRQRIQIVFQNPYDSLNPRHRVIDAVARPAQVLRNLSAQDARAEVAELLERVRLPARLANRYPGEISGGERQRVAIARALAAKPDLLICDEITSALDVSVQAAVLELLAELREATGLALLFITHDLGVVANIADRTLVFETGIVQEHGNTIDIIQNPTHPYTQRLINAAPLLPGTPSAAIEYT